MSNIDFTDFNNGTPPVKGLEWMTFDDGSSEWVLPSSGSLDGNDLTVTPPGNGGTGGGVIGDNQTALQKENSARIHEAAKQSQIDLDNQKAYLAAQQANFNTYRSQEAATLKALNTQLGQNSDIRLSDIRNRDQAYQQKVAAKFKEAMARGGTIASELNWQKKARRAQEAAEKAADDAKKAENDLKVAQEKQAREQARTDAINKLVAQQDEQNRINAERAEAARKAEEARKAQEAQKQEEARKAETAKREEEARQEAEQARKTEVARKAMFSSVGIIDAPSTYTAEMVRAANVALSESGALVLNRAPGMVQFSAAGSGSFPFNSELAGWEASAEWRGVLAVAEEVVTSVITKSAVIMSIFYSPSAGEGSDKVPDFSANLLASQAQLFTAGKVTITPGMKTVDLPVRGYLSKESPDRQTVNLVKTGTGGISPSVPVLNAVRDNVTGLDKIILPAVGGEPARTILINPVPTGPNVPAHTGNTSPVPSIPVHTGSDIKQADSIVTTSFPVSDIPMIRDFIYWQPDATGTGVEPIYVMLSTLRDLPGIASGKGTTVGDGWLDNAGKELGAPIPSQIADKLRGRQFANFVAFRRAFWMAVYDTPELRGQFKKQNEMSLKKGYAPFPIPSEQVGGRARFELHHIKRVIDGGAVYDIDNLRVMTPKAHIELHQKGI